MPAPTRLLTIAFTVLAMSCHPHARTEAHHDAGLRAAASAPSAVDSGVPSVVASATPADAVEAAERAYALALAACESVANTAIPAGDEPTAAETVKLRACEAEALYYGIERPADFDQARKCAYVERASKKRRAMAGAAILAMLYANGKGVPQNLELAQRFVCELVVSRIELSAHLEVLSRAKQRGGLASPFDVCDYEHLSSGFWVGACASHDARLSSGAREARRVKAMEGLPRREASAFVRAAKAFTVAHIRGELNLAGTMSDAFAASERLRLEADLSDTLETLRRDFTPPRLQPDSVERELNALYRELVSCFETQEAKDTPRQVGLPSSKGIRETERLWLVYREAFAQLVLKVRPEADSGQWRAWITQKRNDMLRHIRSEC